MRERPTPHDPLRDDEELKKTYEEWADQRLKKEGFENPSERELTKTIENETKRGGK